MALIMYIQNVEGVPVAPLALQPENGGPRKLPVVKVYLNDIEDEEQAALARKPHLVIVGGGWGVCLCILACSYTNLTSHCGSLGYGNSQ